MPRQLRVIAGRDNGRVFPLKENEPLLVGRDMGTHTRLKDPHVAMLLLAEPVDSPYLHDAFLRGVCGVIWRPIEFDVATDLIRTAHQASRDRMLIRKESELTPNGAVK